MKKILFILIMALMVVTGPVAFSEESEKKESKSLCPKTKISKQEMCFTCHTTPNFKLKESPPNEGHSYPHGDMWVLNGVAYLKIGTIDPSAASNFLETLYYLDWHPEIKHLVINLYSYGGSLFQAWRMIGYIDQYQSRGYTIETRNYGVSASAAFLIMTLGTKGHRFVSKTSQSMAHELRQYGSLLELFTGKTPSDSEEQTRIMRYLQDSINIWLATKGNLTIEEIKKQTTNREFWMRGEESIKYGFADGFIK